MYQSTRFSLRRLQLVLVISLATTSPTASVLAQTQPSPVAKQQQLVGQWHKNFEQAEAEAKRLNKPLLIHFYADWCLPCKRMDHESLGNPAVLRMLGRQIVGVKVNIDKQKHVALRFKVQSLPGDIILDPNGKVLAQSKGYQPTQKYLGQLFAASNRFLKSPAANPPIAKQRPKINKKPLIIARPNSRPQPKPTTPVKLKRVSVKKPPLGMDGYNPVALFAQRKWMKGDRRFAALYKGIEYRFNSAAEQKQFLITPAKFAPQLLGCDPVVLHETDRARSGGAKYAAYFDGRLYLFVGNNTRLKFKQQPLRYTRTQHVLLLDDETKKSRTKRQ